MLPSQCRLIPTPGSASPQTPPTLYMKLTPALASAIVDSKGAAITLYGTGEKNRVELRIGGQTVLPATLIPEAAHVDLYQGARSSSEYGHVARMTHRVTLQRSLGDPKAPASGSSSVPAGGSRASTPTVQAVQPPPTPPPSSKRTSPPVASSDLSVAVSIISTNNAKAPELPDLTRPLASLSLHDDVMRILHLLALGPNPVSLLASRTQLDPSVVQAVLSAFCRKSEFNASNWVLMDSTYKDLRIWEWNYSPADRRTVLSAASAAFDRLGYGADHAARRGLRDSRTKKRSPLTVPATASVPMATTAKTQVATPGSSSRVSPVASPSVSPNPHRGLTPVASPKPSHDAASPRVVAAKKTHSGSSLSKRLSVEPDSLPAKRLRPDDDDLFALASRFRNQYMEYTQLYAVVKAEQDASRRRAELSRLLSMHRELESWKRRLWAAPPQKR